MIRRLASVSRSPIPAKRNFAAPPKLAVVRITKRYFSKKNLEANTAKQTLPPKPRGVEEVSCATPPDETVERREKKDQATESLLEKQEREVHEYRKEVDRMATEALENPNAQEPSS